jgi:hypothetical protein
VSVATWLISTWQAATAHAPSPTDLGITLVRLGLVTEAQLQAARDRQRLQRKARLGQILLAAGVLTEAQLAAALAHQKRLRHGRATEAMADLVEARLGALDALAACPSGAVRPP